MKAKLYGLGSRCNEVRAAECRQEVVHRGFIGQVDDSKPQAPLVTVAMEKIIVPDARVEQVARRNARRIVVRVVRARGGEIQKF